jgi:mRNA interferase RelE/StbE
LAYRILYKKSVQKDLKRLGTIEAKKVISKVEKELSKKADAYPMLKGQFAGLRKYRFSDYRVIYALLDDEVLVLRIGHRKEIYKKEI